MEKSVDNYTIDGSIRIVAEELQDTIRNSKIIDGPSTKNIQTVTPIGPS